MPARLTNGVLIRVTVGSPAFSSSMLSWTLHDVQDPQSPRAVITTSALSRKARKTPASAGREGCFFDM